MKYEKLTGEIIGCFYEVYRTLGSGFLEKVYEKSLAVEFQRRGIKFGQQIGIGVCYKGEDVGNYILDFLVEGCVVVEVKAKSSIEGFDEAQVINYLKATGKEVGLLVNFGNDDIEFRRLVRSEDFLREEN